jgi:proline dehydrogenase
MTATLDYLGENVTTSDEAIAGTDAACRILQAIRATGIDCNLSLKLTQLGLDLGNDLALANLEQVVGTAAECDNFVRIDMESSEYVERTLAIFFQVFPRFRNVGVVIQAYLYRSRKDLERLIEAGARVRLVKGAYLESPEVAFQRKADVDASFVHLMEMLLAGGEYPAIATHDPVMIDATRRFAGVHGIDRSRFEFQMLYGIRRDLQSRLVAEGYRTRIYVPYGTQWYPYLMRRMAERPANVMFVLGNIAREAAARPSRRIAG